MAPPRDRIRNAGSTMDKSYFDAVDHVEQIEAMNLRTHDVDEIRILLALPRLDHLYYSP